jgi:hypothetical protein
MTMKYINVNAAGNLGLVACFKQECHTMSCLVWHTIKNHITTISYHILLVCKKDFAFECTKTGNVIYEGFTLLQMIYTVVKLNLVVDVKDLQLKMEKMTLLTTDNNFHTLATSLEELQQEIHAKKGEFFCKDDKLMTELLHAAEATTNKLFAINVSLAKTARITGKATNKNIIINDLCVLDRDSLADGSWGKVSSANSKIISLTTQVNGLKAKLKNAAGSKTTAKNNKPDAKSNGKGDKEPSKKWRYTKVGETTKDPVTGATAKWYPHHGTEAYMSNNHNHAEWLEKKKKHNAKWAEGRTNKRVKFNDETKAKVTTKPAASKDEKHPTKLQLASSICQSLVTHCLMTPTKVNNVFDKAFECAMDSN